MLVKGENLLSCPHFWNIIRKNVNLAQFLLVFHLWFFFVLFIIHSFVLWLHLEVFRDCSQLCLFSFFSFLFRFWSHIRSSQGWVLVLYSGITSSRFRGPYVWCQGLNLGWLHSGNLLTCWYYHASPQFILFLKVICLFIELGFWATPVMLRAYSWLLFQGSTLIREPYAMSEIKLGLSTWKECNLALCSYSLAQQLCFLLFVFILGSHMMELKVYSWFRDHS